MQLLVPLQHFNKLANSPSPSLGLLSSLNSKKKGITIRPVQSGEKITSPDISIQSQLEILRNRRALRRVVRIVPTPILFGAIDLGKSSRPHPPILNQSQRFPTINFGPNTLLSPRTKPLQPRICTLALFLPINPAITQRFVKSLSIRNRSDARILFRDSNPNPGRRRMILRQPGSPSVRARKILGGFAALRENLLHPRAPSKSPIKSRTSSTPTDNRTRESPIPTATR